MNRNTATHESGHAIARLMTSELMGLRLEQAVDSIDVDNAICYGPMVSASLDLALKNQFGETEVFLDDVWDQLAVIGNERERRASMISKMLITVFGAAAESKLQRMPDPTPVFQSFACSQDRVDFGRCCKVLNIQGTLVLEAEADFLKHASQLVKRPSVWSAINSIAFALREMHEPMLGLRIAELAWPHLSGDQEALNNVLPPKWSIDL